MKRLVAVACLAMLSASAFAQQAASQPAATMNLLSWDEAKQPGIQRFVWVRSWYGGGQYQAEVAAKQLAAMPPGKRVIFFWQDCFTPTIDRVHAAQQLATGIEFNSQPFYAFFERLKVRGIVPDRIVLDYEDSLVTFAIGPMDDQKKREAFFDDLTSDTGFQLVMPDVLKGVTGKQLLDNGPMTKAYNTHVMHLCIDALRRCVARPAWETLGTPVPITNFTDVRTSFETFDRQNWPTPAETTLAVGFESSPGLYLNIGNRLRQPSLNTSGAKKHPGWNALIDSLNLARSCANRGPLVPWIARPDYGSEEFPLWMTRRLNQELLRHLHAMGTTTLLYFNPRPDLKSDPKGVTPQVAAQSEAMMQKLLSELGLSMPLSKQAWEPIPLDADEFSTGAVRWTYKEFVAELYAPRDHAEKVRERK